MYFAATLAGAGLGLLVLLEVLPSIPEQLTSWLESLRREVALAVSLVGGGAIGATLAATAHLGVRWQLRRRSAAGSTE